MAQHDKYDMDILKQLTRIANSLERIEKNTCINNINECTARLHEARLKILMGEPMYESLKKKP